MSAWDDFCDNLETYVDSMEDEILHEAERGNWTASNGRTIPFRKMSGAHLSNALHYLTKKNPHCPAAVALPYLEREQRRRLAQTDWFGDNT